MNQVTKLTAVLFLIILSSFTPEKHISVFQEKLSKTKMTFVMSTEFQEIKVILKKQMNYDYAIKHLEKDFEVRFAIQP